MTHLAATPPALPRPSGPLRPTPTAAPSTGEDYVRYLRHMLSTTPGRLRLCLAAIWVLIVLFAWFTSVAVDRHHHEMQTIGRDSAPSIIAAQSIKWNLADMHDNVIRQFLGTSLQAQAAAKIYQERRANVTDGLLAAAQNITYGDAERIPIRNLMNGLVEYDEAVAQSRTLGIGPNGQGLARLRDAGAIMDGALLPAADALDRANQQALDHEYTQEQSTTGLSTAMFILCGIGVIGGLVGLQLLVQRRMHRRISLALIAAILVTAVFTSCIFSALRDETNELTIAKKDAFDSISTLRRARADAYDAQSHLSLSLLGPASGPSADHVFDSDSANVARLSYGLSFEGLASSVDPHNLPDGFQGYIAAELRNITFEGEQEAAMNMMRWYARYMIAVHRLREANGRGEHPVAVELCLGDSSDQAHGALAEFDGALGKVIEINQAEFEHAINRGFDAVEGLGFWIIATALVVAFLAYIGVLQRLKEYRM